MTIVIGARCHDGVTLVSDRRLVRIGGLEPQLPRCKLMVCHNVLTARVGMSAFHDAIERMLAAISPDGSTPASVWDVADIADQVVNKYEGFKEDRPLFPVIDRMDGKARLWQVTGGFPPGEMEYESWGLPESYGAIGRLFHWYEIPVDRAWRAMLVMIAMAAKVSVGVGDGADVAIIRDGEAAFEVRKYLDPDDKSVQEAYARACKWVDFLPEIMLNAVMGT